jgi:GT2 family glycosyltransferase
MDLTCIAVVILNYNGKEFLKQFLPSVLQHSGNAQIIVADNASSDDSLKFVKENYPNVKIVLNERNYGYAQGYNEALKKIKSEYFVLLNNDVEVTDRWLEPMLELLSKNGNIAACQPKLLSFRQKNEFEYAGAAGGFIDKYCYPFCRGRIFNELEKDSGQFNDSREIFWASGACLFARASAFEQVGGFDGDFFAHMEEIDLCWRMKNLGHRVFYEGKSVVYHVGGGTLNKVSPRKTFLNFRNNLITLTKNHPSGLLWLKIFYRMNLDGIAAMKFLLSGQASHFFAVIRAHFSYYGCLSSTLRKRKQQKQNSDFKFSTSQIYSGNIVFDHFLKGLKKFSDLNSPFLK